MDDIPSKIKNYLGIIYGYFQDIKGDYKPKSEDSTELIDINQLQADKESLYNSGEEDLFSDFIKNSAGKTKTILRDQQQKSDLTLRNVTFFLTACGFNVS